MVQTQEHQAEVLGAEVLAIGQFTTTDLLGTLREVFRPETEATFRTGVCRELGRMADLLFAAGLLPRDSRTPFRFRLANGTAVTRELELLPQALSMLRWYSVL